MLTPAAPRLDVVLVRVEPASVEAGRWAVTWRVRNLGDSPVGLREAWIPHGHFRGQGRLPLDVQISPAAEHELVFVVRASEPPGTVVENAFLILRTDAGRVFSRMRIEFDAQGVPRPVVELTTTQSIE